MTTFDDVLKITPTSEILTAEVLAALGAAWNNRPATELVARGMVGLAIDLTTALPNHDNEARLKIAKALMELFAFLGLAPAAPAVPQVLRVQLDKTPDQMTLRELLEYVSADPSRLEDTLRYFASDMTVNHATQNSKYWVILTEDGTKVDIELTLEYARYLGQHGAFPQREYKGRTPTTLRAAFGAVVVRQTLLVQVFLGQPVLNLDPFGFDWTTLDPEIIESIVWALKMRHSLLPASFDAYNHTAEVFTNPLPPRWQRIRDDYRHVKKIDPESVRDISPYWKETAEHGLVTPQFVIVTSQTHVERAAAKFGNLSMIGSNRSIYIGVYETVSVIGNGNMLGKLVITQGGRIVGDNNRGTLFTPPGVLVSVVGNNNQINQQSVDWDNLKSIANA